MYKHYNDWEHEKYFVCKHCGIINNLEKLLSSKNGKKKMSLLEYDDARCGYCFGHQAYGSIEDYEILMIYVYKTANVDWEYIHGEDDDDILAKYLDGTGENDPLAIIQHDYKIVK